MHPVAALVLSPLRPAAALAAIRRSPQRADPPWFVAGVFYALGTLAQAALILRLPGAPSGSEAAVAVGLVALLSAASALFYAVGVELTMDPTMKRGQARALIHRTLCTSGVFGLLSTAAALAGPAAPGVLLACLWWQWMVEALTVRELYGRSYPAAFGVQVGIRLVATVVGVLAGYAVMAPVERIIDSLVN